MVEAGVGAKVTLPVGGKMDMPAIDRKGEPLELTGVVRAITDGEYTITGPQFQGMRCYMGRSAVLDTGAAQIVVIERNQEPWDRGVFTSVGIDPAPGEVPAAQVAHVLPPGVPAHRQGHGVLRRAGRGHLRLDVVRVPQAAPADLSAGRVSGCAPLNHYC